MSFGVERTCSSTWKYMGVSYDETADEHDPDAFWDDGDSVATADSNAIFYLG